MTVSSNGVLYDDPLAHLNEANSILLQISCTCYIIYIENDTFLWFNISPLPLGDPLDSYTRQYPKGWCQGVTPVYFIFRPPPF